MRMRLLGILVVSLGVSFNAGALVLDVDSISRDVLIRYQVPADAPDEVIVSCEYSLGGGGFSRAAVRKYRSLTAENILAEDKDLRGTMKTEMGSGVVKEWMAAGLRRTLVWQTGGQLPVGAVNDVLVKVVIRDTAGNILKNIETQATVDLSDVVVLSDFSKVLQKDMVALEKRDGPGWYWTKPTTGPFGLLATGDSDFILDPLTLRPRLEGYYAIYVGLPYSSNGSISLRLSDEMYDQVLYAQDPRECFWKIADLTGKNLVISQWDKGLERTALNYIRLVPVSSEAYRSMKDLDGYARDKIVAGHTEPFSWGAFQTITKNSEYAEILAAFRDSKLDWVDFQMGRLGAKPIYPTALDEPIVESTLRETAPGSARVSQNGSATLCMSTDAMGAVRLFADAFGVGFSANFGAGIAYPKSPLRAAWADSHSEYLVKDTFAQYKYPVVRNAMLAYFKESLERGARRLSLDFCRYPNVIEENDKQTATLFLTELRALADSYSGESGNVQILVRFPVEGVPGRALNYNPAEWVKNGLVDVLVPSGTAGNVNYFNVSPYVELVKGTGVKCLPCVSLLSSGLPFPLEALRRIDQLYDAGCDGVYLYQSELKIVGSMSMGAARGREILARMGSSLAVKKMIKDFEAANSEYSRDMYIHYPLTYKNYRARVLIEGFVPEEVKTYTGGNLVNTFGSSAEFLRFGEDGYQNDYTPATGVKFTVKAKLDGRWVERERKMDRIY